jgi:hypothetical protein
VRLPSPYRVAITTLVFIVAIFVPLRSALPASEPLQIARAALTGDQAQIGQDYLNGVKLAVDAWNARGASSAGRSLLRRKMMQIADGRARIGDAAGLGVEVDVDALAVHSACVG